jgi:hypothetical protein
MCAMVETHNDEKVMSGDLWGWKQGKEMGAE